MAAGKRKHGIWGVAWPVGHLLALAPLDVWLRLIWGARVRPRYWLRLVGCSATSWVGTVVTLPERLVVSVVRLMKFGGPSPRFQHDAGVVVVLGYYRSGTTHLQNLLACDPRVVTPRWYQCLAGQGWLVSWAVVRFMLTPFLGQTRPQDGVGFGGSWPGEDDFALATWGAASSLPGRFVYPSQSARWDRWHALDQLGEKERTRWRSLTAAFCWKVTRWGVWIGRPRTLVLKSPSHTARVAELDALFGGRARFIKIERDHEAVVRSNVKMHRALAGHALEDLPGDDQVRARIERELDETERTCADQLEAVDPDRVVRVSYDELVGDPVGTMERVGAGVGLAWDDATSRSTVGYLHRLGRYRGEDDISRLPADPEPDAGVRRTGSGLMVGLAAAVGCAVVWMGLVWLIASATGWDTRLDGMVWVTGGVVGVAVSRVARVGSAVLGLVAAVLTVLVFWGTSFPIELLTDNWWGGMNNPEQWWFHNRKGAIAGVTHGRAIVFTVLGAVTAWRHGSRTAPRAPGV